MSTPFDRRVTPARGDLAAAHLKGAVQAQRFAEGRAAVVIRALADLKAQPSEEAGLETQLLFGEDFIVYDEADGWVWGQAPRDSYVGYARAESFAVASGTPTHRVSARCTPLLSAPEVKNPARAILPMNAKLAVADEGGRFLRLTNGFFVFAGHAAPIAQAHPDWVSVAEGFLGAPYLWGGKSAAGLDCSGLVQIALEAGGIGAPRDTDMMEASLGAGISPDAALRRGDLVFWKGHMGVMLDGARLLHANAFFMQVTAEPLTDVRARILAGEQRMLQSVRRLP